MEESKNQCYTIQEEEEEKEEEDEKEEVEEDEEEEEVEEVEEDEDEDEEEEDNAKWVTHYSSDHQILLVGEGDFSFSLSLAKSFGSAANIVASSLNSLDNVIKMYKHAKSNLDDLHKMGARLLHGIDATKMKLHSDLKMRRFDRVIFNFPHAGFHGREDSTMMIKKHKALVLGFFNNASGMLRANGEIHVSHKTTAPFSHWNIKDLAARCFLTLIESADFNIEDYPGYNNKRGDSYRCDEPFPLGKCCTYKFAYIPEAKRKRKKRKQIMFSREQINLPVQEIEYAVEQLPTSVYLSYAPRTSHYLKMKEETSIFALTNRHTSITGCHSSSMAEVHGRGAPSGAYSFGMSLVPPRTLQPMEPLQSLQMRPTSAYFRYSLTDHIPVYTRRTLQPMQPLQSSQTWQTSTHTRYPLYHPRILETDRVSLDARNEWYHQVNGGRSNYFLEEHGGTMHPAPLSHGARNEGYYHQVYGGRSNYFLEEHGGTMHNAHLSHGARNEGYYHRVYGGCSNDWQQEHCCRTTNQSASSLYGVSSEFDRFTAEVPGRNVQSELHRMNILMSEKRVFVQS